MKIVFLDPIAWDYNVETPLTQPLGGTQSAICYLTAELARQGHDVSLVNHISAKGDFRGVRCIPWAEGRSGDLLRLADVIIVVSSGAASKLRREGIRTPLVLWTHHRYNQIAMRGLQKVHEREVWSGYAFVSEWMADEYLRFLGIPPERSRVFYNGIGEPFVGQRPKEAWFIEKRAPVLVYTSMPNRGLDVLLEAFPAIRSEIPGVQLRVYSGGSLYRNEQEPDYYRVLYERCQRTRGVEYIGPVGQTQLARELADAAALAYPATVSETFCLVAAEAMSLGAMLLTTRLGALSELFGEFAHMVNAGGVDQAPDAVLSMDFVSRARRRASRCIGQHRRLPREELAETYSALVINALDAAWRYPAREAGRRSAQISFIRNRYTWPRVATEWVTWLGELVGAERAVATGRS